MSKHKADYGRAFVKAMNMATVDCTPGHCEDSLGWMCDYEWLADIVYAIEPTIIEAIERVPGIGIDVPDIDLRLPEDFDAEL